MVEMLPFLPGFNHVHVSASNMSEPELLLKMQLLLLSSIRNISFVSLLECILEFIIPFWNASDPILESNE